MMSALPSRSISSRMAGVSAVCGTGRPYHLSATAYHRPVTSAASPSGPASPRASARPRRPDPERSSDRPRLVGAVRLRQHDLLVRGGVRCDRALPGQRHQFGERDGNVLLSIAVVISVGINALVSPILGAFSDRGTGRMPFLLFFTALCIGATFFIADVPPLFGLVLFIVANFAYQAALIYYDATLKTRQLSGDPRQAVRDRDRDRLLRDGLRRAADLPPRHPGRGPLPTDRDPVPGVRHPDLPVRPRAARSPARNP